ncbi:MAG: NYN domain-containing protein [Coriobacteriales bacterium]|nr:NYN domain-containing protein [Coriobacteriales bacterium]
MPKTAILVDGGFYSRRANLAWGNTTGKERADELVRYARFHILRNNRSRLEGDKRSLYRIFYYDCPPLNGRSVVQPWNGRQTTFGKSNPVYQRKSEFLAELSKRTKVAMRMGQIAKEKIRYVPTEQAMKDIMNGRRTYDQLGKDDFEIVGMKQTGVDMKIGLDVASLAQSRIVNQIILIADDTDFIPAIKVARRAGVDFLLDPMGNHVNNELLLQVDDIEDLHDSFRPAVTGTRASSRGMGTVH